MTTLAGGRASGRRRSSTLARASARGLASLRRWRSLAPRVSELYPVLSWAYGLVALGLLATLAVRMQWGIPTQQLLRDMATLTGAPPYLGLFSNVGVLLWAAAATVCLFAAALVRRRSRERLAFWTYAGALTLLLLADDLFLFHEILFPYHLHVPEPLVYVLYGLAAVLFLALFRRTILGEDAALLALSLFWFGLSLGVDRWGYVWLPRGFWLVEDGLKLLGIVSWLLFFARAAYREATRLRESYPSVALNTWSR